MEATFLEWAKSMTKDTSFGSQKVVLTEEHFAPLLQVKSFQPVLRQLVRRVRPHTEREHIRLNLNHLSLRKESRHKRLLKERASSKLEEKRVCLEVAVHEAKKDLSREALLLKGVVEEEERLVREEQDLKRQIALLSFAAEEKEQKTKNVKRWAEPISELIPEHPVLPSAPAQKSLKQQFAHEELQTILSRLKELKCNVLHKQGEHFHSDKLEVWQLVESYVERHSPSDISRALSTCTSRETNSLSQITNQIDLVSDARALRLKYEPSGELVDELNPEGPLETIESLLVQMCGKHVKNHFRNEKERTDIANAAESLRCIKNNIQTVAKNLYSDPTLVAQIMNICNETMNLCSLRAALSASTPLARRLEARAVEANAAKEKMLKEYEKVNQFESQVKRDVSLLKSLSIAASQSWEQLEHERSSIMTVAEKGMTSLELPTPTLKGGFLKEVDAVMELPLHYLGLKPLTDGPINCQNEGLNSLSRSTSHITSWLRVISLVRQKKCALRLNELLMADVAALNTLATDMKQETLFAARVRESLEKAKSHDACLEEKILPLLRLCEQTNDQMEQNLLQTRKVIDEWWAQPGPSIKEYLAKLKN